MEKSPEIASGHNTSYFRELDARTGRWWSVDPVWQPWQSPYCTFDNNPVVYADPHGDKSDCDGCEKGYNENNPPTKEVLDELRSKGATIVDEKTGEHYYEDANVVADRIPNATVDKMNGLYSPREIEQYITLRNFNKRLGRDPYYDPSVRNIESNVNAGVHRPITYTAGSRSGGSTQSAYGHGLQQIAVYGIGGAGLGVGATVMVGGMSVAVAREIGDEVVDVAFEAATGMPLPPTSLIDAVQLAQRRGDIVQNIVQNSFFSLPRGGKNFKDYKEFRPKGLIDVIPLSNGGVMKVWVEYHHMFIPQRWQSRFNLPNWVVHNRINVWRLNSIQHSIIDPHRFQFLPRELKSQVGLFKRYNWFTFPRNINR